MKDEILKSYLKPYFQKILRTNRGIVYIDCFAGKGKFDDQEIGSPLIAIEIIRDVLHQSKNKNPNLKCYFIESKYNDDLNINLDSVLSEKNRKYVISIEGLYEEKITEVLDQCKGKNLFLYIDPFGIKNLHFDILLLIKKEQFHSSEILLNLNSFGFIREACRLMGVECRNDLNNEFVERENLEEISNKQANSIQNMNRVAHGDYWQELIANYKKEQINAFDVEEIFVKKYCEQLKLIFKFVINIPIKAKKMKNMPKYQMVFATNHKHGFITMATNMNKRWNEMKEKEKGGQLSLFEYDIDGRGKEISENLKDTVLKNIPNDYISYEDYLCKFIISYSIFKDISAINKIIRQLEKEEKIEILRDPPLTEKRKEKTTWVNYEKNMKVRKKNENYN